MKKVYLFIALLLLNISVKSQYLDTNWVNQYDRVSLYQDSKITPLSNNQYLLVHGLDYIKLGTNGDSLTKGTFSTTITTLNTVNSIGNDILIGGASTNGPELCRLDLNFDTMWCTTIFPKAFSQGVYEIHVDGSDIYVSGSGQSNIPFIAKLNTNGDTLWNTDIPQTTFSNLTSIIKLSDGNFLASGNLDDYPLAIKFDSSGDTVWTYQETIFISFSKMSAFEKNNGDIVLIPYRKFITLNSSGIKTTESDFTLNHYLDVVEKGDTIYLIGSQRDNLFNGNSYPIVEVRNKNLDSLYAFIDSNNIHPLVDNRFSDGFLSSTGEIIVSGLVRDSVNITANTWNLKAAKFNGTTVTSIQPIDKLRSIVAYPNPTSGLIYLNSPSTILKVKVINIMGETVRIILNNQQTVSLSGLPAGTYFLRINTIEGTSITKILKL